MKTAKQWWNQRRPEIMEAFDREIYGRVPSSTPKVNWEVTHSEEESNGGIAVVTKQGVGHVDNRSYPQVSVDIQLTVSTPRDAIGPVPVMMEFGLSREALAALAKRFPQWQSASNSPTWRQQVLVKGWGYAVYIPTSVQADNGEGLTQGIIGLMNRGQPRKLDDWGALRAWAWGASRALDYFETDKAIDSHQVGIEGHSRYGKAALIAMAYDQRFRIAYISSSGKGGAALYRRNFGEQIGNVAGTSEYHWMAGNFLKYDGPLTANDLSVDSHELIAMCVRRARCSSVPAPSQGTAGLTPAVCFSLRSLPGRCTDFLANRTSAPLSFRKLKPRSSPVRWVFVSTRWVTPPPRIGQPS